MIIVENLVKTFTRNEKKNKKSEFNAVDGMHLTRKGHAQLAALLAELVPGLLPG